MELEYLFISAEKRKELSEYKPEEAVLNIYEIENSKLWIATFSSSGNNEESAKALAIVNEFVINNFSCITLTNEAAYYFNNTLYPYINEFERKLRKLLYLVSKLSDQTEGAENIKELELMDLGSLFELIFADTNFIKKAKETTNNKSWQFTKRELIQSLSDIEETPLWNRFFGSSVTPVLCDKFSQIRNYRNDVMHAHNFNAEKYKEAKKLFQIVNKELTEAINNVLKLKSKTATATEKADIPLNVILKEAIDAAKISKALSSVSDQQKELQETFKAVASIDLAANQLKEIKEKYKAAMNINFSADQLKEMQEKYKAAMNINLSADHLKEMQEKYKAAMNINLSADHLKEMQEKYKAAISINLPVDQLKEMQEKYKAVTSINLPIDQLKEMQEKYKAAISINLSPAQLEEIQEN